MNLANDIWNSLCCSLDFSVNLKSRQDKKLL